MINYADASLFLQDSLDKQIHIVSEDNTINITNEDIVGESFTLTESLCSEENLIFGSCEPSCIKFTVKNTFPRMYKKWFNVTITLEGSETPFVVGTYRVWGEKPSSDRSTREITAYDVLYKIFKTTYKKWYKSLWENTDSMTIKQFRDAWFARLEQTHDHISQETTNLVNDDVVIKKSTKITKPSGKDIFNAICEINGVFGRIGRDGVFHYVTLSNSNTAYSISKTQTIEVDYEDYSTTAIDRVEILDSEGEVLGQAGAEADNAENTYTIENNFMLKGLGNDNAAKDTGHMLALHLYNILHYITYVPFDAEFKGNPCFETGDRISFQAHDTTLTSFILERTMSGIQSLHDDYIAEGEGTYPERTNTLSSQIKTNSEKIGALEYRAQPFVGEELPIDEDFKTGDIWIKTTQPHIADVVTKSYPVYKLFDVQNSPNSRYSYATMSITCIHGNFIMVAVNNFPGYNPAYTGDILRNYYSIYPICRVPKGTPIDSVLSSCFSVEQSDLNYYNYEDGTPGWPPTEFGCFADDIQDTIRIFGQRQLSDNFDYYHALFGAGTYKGGMRAFKEPAIGNGVDYFFETEEELITALYNDELEFPDIYEGEYTNNIKYNDNGEWKDVDYISKVDKSADAGGETWNGLQVSEENKKLSLKKNVMRAWYKADPPQTQRNFSQFCVRYTGEPDSDIEIESYANHTWANIDIKADDENAFKIKCGGVGGSGKYCAYKITGLTSGERYYFNFAVNFSNGATFGNNTSKGLGLVFNTTGTINTDDWSGNEDTFNDSTLYYSMRRSTTKNYADFSFIATSNTMYMCVVTADITSSSSINLVLSEFVISKSERKLIRNIYLYDYEKDVWLKYRPFGSVAGSEGGEGSVVTITPTLQTGVKVADYSIDGDSGEIYAPQGGSTIEELNDIGDVNINNPSSGQVLKYDATNQEWVNGNDTGGVSALSDLTDVNFDNPSDGQIIEYDSESGKWVNVTPTIPSINGVQLVGNKTTSDLGIFITLTQSEYDALTTEEKEDLRIFYFVTEDEPEPPAPTYLYTGTFTSASTSQGKVDIDCGFEPNYILVVLPFGNGNTYAIYAEMLSTTVSKWWIPMEHNKYDIIIGSETGETGINDILSNGFKFRSNGGNTQGVNCQVSARLLNNTNSLSGTFTTSNVVDGVVDVSCGFRPAYVLVILPFSQSSITYAIYEEEISDTTSLWMIDAERNIYTLTIGAASGETGICDITNDGFKFRSHGRNTLNISCTFIACE